jgi:glycine amidinotransferase
VTAAGPNPSSPVSAHNEWDPLEEVIVGIVDGASFPGWHLSLPPVLPPHQVATFRRDAHPGLAELVRR